MEIDVNKEWSDLPPKSLKLRIEKILKVVVWLRCATRSLHDRWLNK
jgi:hypothetical protein